MHIARVSFVTLASRRERQDRRVMMSDLTSKDPHEPSGRKQRWWKTDPEIVHANPRAQRGEPCPQCLMADLAFDSLFRLRCPVCGYVAACGAFT